VRQHVVQLAGDARPLGGDGVLARRRLHPRQRLGLVGEAGAAVGQGAHGKAEDVGREDDGGDEHDVGDVGGQAVGPLEDQEHDHVDRDEHSQAAQVRQPPTEAEGRQHDHQERRGKLVRSRTPDRHAHDQQHRQRCDDEGPASAKHEQRADGGLVQQHRGQLRLTRGHRFHDAYGEDEQRHEAVAPGHAAGLPHDGTVAAARRLRRQTQG
jgi:hypothetical protein